MFSERDWLLLKKETRIFVREARKIVVNALLRANHAKLPCLITHGYETPSIHDVSWLINGGIQPLTDWDDPPSMSLGPAY